MNCSERERLLQRRNQFFRIGANGCAGWAGNSADGYEFTARPHDSFSSTYPGRVSVADEYLAPHRHEHKIVATIESFTEEKLVWNPRFSASPAHMCTRDQTLEIPQTLV